MPHSHIQDFRESKDDDDENVLAEITANAIKFAHSHNLAYYDVKSKFGKTDNGAFMKELDQIFVALGQQCASKIREQTIALQRKRTQSRRPSRRGGGKGVECVIQ